MSRQFAVQQKECELLEEFVAALERSSSVRVDSTREWDVQFRGFDGKMRLDARLGMQAPGEATIVVELIASGFPRDMRHAVWTLQEYVRGAAAPPKVIMAVVAERLSPGAREVLRAREIAYYDRSGSLFFKHGDITIDIDRPAKSAERGTLGSEFEGAREQVVHALLHTHGRPFTGLELASLSGTSPFTVSQTLRILEPKGLVEGQRAGRGAQRRLADPGALLDAWAAVWIRRPEPTTEWFFFAAKPGQMGSSIGWRLLKAAGISDWAYTGAEAGNYLAPLLTSVDRLDLVVPPGRALEIARAVPLQAAKSGWNVRLIERSGAATMFQRPIPEYDMPLASPYVVYLDLLKDDRGRNKELAQHLRANVLKI